MSDFNAGVRAAEEALLRHGCDEDGPEVRVVLALLRPEPAPEPDGSLYGEHTPISVGSATCTAQTGPAAACVYREPLLRTAADMERG